MQSGCRPCHEECTSCLDGSASCGLEYPQCRHYQQGGECVRQCAINFYLPQLSRVFCRPCHQECRSCTGPSEFHCKDCRSLTVYNSSYSAFDDGLVNSTVQDVRFYNNNNNNNNNSGGGGGGGGGSSSSSTRAVKCLVIATLR